MNQQKLKKISSFLKTEHSEFFINKKILKETFFNLGEIWDEPFADFSQIPTYLISKLSKKDVTVVLTGYGGDELFMDMKDIILYSLFGSPQNIYHHFYVN